MSKRVLSVRSVWLTRNQAQQLRTDRKERKLTEDVDVVINNVQEEEEGLRTWKQSCP